MLARPPCRAEVGLGEAEEATRSVGKRRGRRFLFEVDEGTGNFGFDAGGRKFGMGDLVTVRDPILRIDLVFEFELLEIV